MLEFTVHKLVAMQILHDTELSTDNPVTARVLQMAQDALKKQIPKDPISSHGQWEIRHCCPVCNNILKAPTFEQFRDGSYCDKCGQKIKWGGDDDD